MKKIYNNFDTNYTCNEQLWIMCEYIISEKNAKALWK